MAVTFHGHDVSGLRPENRLTGRYARYQLFARRMFEQASMLLCASQELADILVGDFDAPESKIRIHRLGVDLSRFTVPQRGDGPAKVLMVGRMVEKKGMEYGIQAFAKALQKYPDTRLKIVGDGPLRESLQRLVSELGLEHAIEFAGVLASDGVRDAMQEADILIAPSVVAANGDRESGVIVLKEAAAVGLPCVGTIHGGIPEIIDDGETGFLVPERDVNRLEDRLCSLIGDEGTRRKMGVAARKKIEQEYCSIRQNQRLESQLAEILRN